MIVTHILVNILELSYPMGVLIGGTVKKQTGYNVVSEYIGFIGYSVLDFISALGYLFLFLKMGQRNIKQTLKDNTG